MSGKTRSRAETAAHIRRLLRTEGESMAADTQHDNRARYAAVSALGERRYEELKDQTRAIKEDAIENLPALIDTLVESVEANGGHVHLASDAADANRYINEVCADADATSVVKSKSMTTEEIHVNDAIEADGRAVYETDLGEFVIQLADEPPSHLVGPAAHKSRAEIAALFNEHFDLEEPLETVDELTAFARKYVGDRIREAEVGMTGANFLVAESGSLVLVTNEGNDRKVIEATDTHIAVAGVEKILPSMANLGPFLELLPRSGTGQPLTSYVSILTPPVNSPTLGGDRGGNEDGGGNGDENESEDEDGNGERDFHLVLIDNGRMAMREDAQLRETLYCIRCSACLNSCANFQHVGGHAFGGETYTGGIATGWEAGIRGEEGAADFNDLCTGCSRCVNQCPVRIDIPWINTVVRDRLNHGDSGDLDFVYEGLVPDDEPGGLDPQKRLFGNFETLAKWGSRLAPASNWLAGTSLARNVLERTLGVDARRELPRFRRETLRDWDAGRTGLAARDAEREVVLYPDIYTNHVQVERGKAAVRALEALDIAVRIPAVPESGRAPLSQGMISTAESKAHAVFDALRPHIEAGRDVVVIEPSDLAMFYREYEKLLPEAAFSLLRSNSYEVMDYLDAAIRADGTKRERLSDPVGDGRLAYHSHCQQRTLGLEEPTVRLLETLGYDVRTSDVECCGMAGSFGYKSQYYDLSMDVGAELAEQFSEAEAGERIVVASGTSCLEQLDSLDSRVPRHPVELLAPNW